MNNGVVGKRGITVEVSELFHLSEQKGVALVFIENVFKRILAVFRALEFGINDCCVVENVSA